LIVFIERRGRKGDRIGEEVEERRRRRREGDGGDITNEG